MGELDHLVVAARTLEEGDAWIASRLGVHTVAGGRHPLMGTHNRLLGLAGRRYLEVIAIDPQAPPPVRPRWFSLDTDAMRERLAQGPALIHWVQRVDDIEGALASYPERVDVLDVSRGELTWRIGVPRDGRLPCEGACPTLIQWKGTAHPCDLLPDSGCALLELRTGGPLAAVFSSPSGKGTLAAGE